MASINKRTRTDGSVLNRPVEKLQSKSTIKSPIVNPKPSINKSRLAMGGRYTSGDVKVYDGITCDYLSIKTGNLECHIYKLGYFQVRGKDRYHHN